MKVPTAALTAAALAGSAAAMPIVHRRSVAQLNGTHYETKWKEAHDKYLALKAQSATISAQADRWLAISNANKEAFNAWGDQDFHKTKWDSHLDDRDQLFQDFLVPKHQAYTQKQAEYQKAQLDLDALLAEYKANHTQRKLPIQTKIADDEKGITDTNTAIDSLNARIDGIQTQITTKTSERTEHQRLLQVHKQELADEVDNYVTYNATIHEQKKRLAIDNGVWNQTHEVDWANRSKYWHDDRDTQEAALKNTYEQEFQEWLHEKFGADISNGHCPCQNGGTCQANLASVEAYQCACPTGYQGTDCEIDIDHCASNPCQNGGTCTDGVLGHTCACPAGYIGSNCETDIDHCASNPCQNGGTCTDGVLAHTCACPAGYIGSNCEIDIDHCASNPCQNGGTCTDGALSYTCACPALFTGTDCGTRVGPVLDSKHALKQAIQQYIAAGSSWTGVPIRDWDTSNIRNMEAIFDQQTQFNADLSNWDTSKVTNMENMFQGATEFNGDISKWSTSRVTDMTQMFAYTKFNRDLSKWDVSKVKTMSGLFLSGEFNRDINSWNMGAVTSMGSMFALNKKFNLPIGDWNTASVKSVGNMFLGASTFNQDLNKWNMAQCTGFNGMFGRTIFNAPIGNWNMQSAWHMGQMFYENRVFDQPIGDWDVSKVEHIPLMFYNAWGFKQNLAKWSFNNLMDKRNAFPSSYDSARLAPWY